MKPRHLVLLLSIALLAGIGGALAFRLLTEGETPSAPASLTAGQEAAADLVGSRRPDYTLGSSTGAIVSASEFDGRVVLVNFWATWCAPCREEMPMLARLHRDYSGQGFEVVGIALDDVQPAREFAAELGIDYPILVGAMDVMAVVRLYGNVSGVLPYSVLVDRAGVIRWTHLGVLQEESLSGQVRALLAGMAPAVPAQVLNTQSQIGDETPKPRRVSRK